MDVSLFKKYFPKLSSSKELVSTIQENSTQIIIPSNTVILKENSYIKVIPFLLNGLIKVYKEEENGNEVLLYYIEPGESCIMSIIAAQKNEKIHVKGVVEEDATIIALPIDVFLKQNKTHSNWSNFIYDLFNNKFDEVIDMIKILTFSNKETRLLEYLNKKSELNNSKTITKSHQEIANELGSSREVISRLLKKLENSNIVSLAQREIKIL
jgi:CRP/FNR family transcriptional regulator